MLIPPLISTGPVNSVITAPWQQGIKLGMGVASAGSRQLDPVFEQTAFKLDYLTRPNAFSDMGFDFGKARPWVTVRLLAGALAAHNPLSV